MLNLVQCLVVALSLHVAAVAGEYFKPFNVSFDHRAIIIDGRRRILNSAGIHYPRATPQMWPGLISKSKEGGIDVIETYAFWNGQEPVRGQYNFEGKYDLVKFAKLVGSSGLYLQLRIGPYICAEWNFGGFPVWLRDVPGIEFRTDNSPFKIFFSNFIINSGGDAAFCKKDSGSDARQFAPILARRSNHYVAAGMIPFVMVQTSVMILVMMMVMITVDDGRDVYGLLVGIEANEVADGGGGCGFHGCMVVMAVVTLMIENEYGYVAKSYGQKGKDYISWAVNMAVGLGAGVPWVMCKQLDAPEFIIDTCNGFYCDGFRPNSDKKPLLWTENWSSWYTTWGGKLKHRPVEDLAFAVARFFQLGGSFQNYYMYFGGTSFGRTAGGPMIITSYDYDAPLDEYGLLRQPKWGHLKDLHAAIKLCEPALVAVDSPQYLKLGPMQEAHVYSGDIHNQSQTLTFPGNSSRCSAFLANIDEHEAYTVEFLVIIVALRSLFSFPYLEQVVAQTSVKDMPSLRNVSAPQVMNQKEARHISKSWMTVKEPISTWHQYNITVQGILPHLNVTKDHSDYLWYLTRIHITEDDITFWEANNVSPVVTIDRMRDVVRIFINGQLTGSARGHWIKVVQPVKLVQGYNDIMLLTEIVGLQDFGPFFEKDGGGFKGRIKVTGGKNGDIDLTESSWTYKVLC
ncbi:hypothetical protein RJ640_012587 [Escallonia rubra]|uniref:beta-galactosidase n=1 Tax=Escallonia rubra TaxID=112253 RepID=A0AA88U0Z9_9ASTE|nr:hypothetical protein RJ640_012587 [Escallonia rubra]